MRYFYLIAPVGVIRATEAYFTYHSTAPLAIGTLVRISIGTKETNGLVIQAVKERPLFKTKAIKTILTPYPLPQQLIKLSLWLADYYATHLGIVLQTLLPAGIHKVRRKQSKNMPYPMRKRSKIVLNNSQLQALRIITSAPANSFLLHGVTGSGKTQVYIEAAKNQARQGKSSIVLVPEIALTPQLVGEFANHFSRLLITHSQMTEADRHKVWLDALTPSQEPFVVIGPRSALFLPLSNIGLIVVDECHEPSYKQELSPRYSALRAASVLAKAHGAKLIFGSATPSVLDYYLAQTHKYPVLKLPKPIAETQEVDISIVDYKHRANFRKHRFLSDPLLQAIGDNLSRNQQTLLFHNRRGTAPTSICLTCGWLAECPTCFLPLTLHADSHELRCHVCSFKQAVPPNCPQCSEPAITFKGIGTKLIEAEIAKLFPKARVARFDADTDVNEALHNQYQAVYDGQVEILIGTQMIAKGLDLPKLGLVGIIQADSGLIIPDYGAEERVFQLLYQVIGRVGRGHTPGQVIIQTFQPDHPIIQAAIQKDYLSFYQTELNKRSRGHFPPFRHLLKLTCRYKTEKGAIVAARALHGHLQTLSEIETMGPSPAFYERLGGGYRWQLIVKAKKRSDLTTIVQNLPKGWQFDLDPVSLL